MMAESFLYFAYGSNMLSKRIYINNPTAIRICTGKLKGYRLDFNYWSNRWHGHAATIVPDQEEDVWGAVWKIDFSNMPDLDRQEGVENYVYKPIDVMVKTYNDEQLLCRSYQLCSLPEKCSSFKKKLPSKVYLDTILQGAKESGLPEYYITKLNSIEHNNNDGPVNLHLDN